jgi:biotin carboxyl carrier protein
MAYKVKVGDTIYRLTLKRDGGEWKCELNGLPLRLHAQLIRRDVISLIAEGKVYEVKRDQLGNQTRIWVKSAPYVAELSDPRSLSSHSRGRGKSGASGLLASMPGKVLRVLVGEMQRVEAGQALLVVEAMKMQNEIKSPNKGTVRQLVSEGTYVNAGDVLAIVD